MGSALVGGVELEEPPIRLPRSIPSGLHWLLVSWSRCWAVAWVHSHRKPRLAIGSFLILVVASVLEEVPQ